MGGMPKDLSDRMTPIGGMNGGKSAAADGAAGAGSAMATDLTLRGGPAATAAAGAAALGCFSEEPLAAAADLSSIDIMRSEP